MPTLSHACVRVLDLARSVAFYRETLGLTPQRELTMEDRGWHLVFLGDGVTPFQLELCRELQRTEPYRLGDDTPHVALVSQDFQGLKAKHQAMGLIFDELANGIYFIQDPDGHILDDSQTVFVRMRAHPGDSSSRLIPLLFQDTSPLEESRGLVSCRYEFVTSCNF